MTFLQETVHQITERHGKDLRDVAVVFQNRRAALYFKHYLAEAYGGAGWLPATYSIQDFFAEMTKRRALDSVELMFVAFEAYREAGGLDTIDEFAAWVQTALSDFDEIDHYQVDVPKFFKALRDLKRIEAWNISGETTPLQRRYLDHLALLELFYLRLDSRLESMAAGYDGHIARRAAENVEAFSERSMFERTYFIGFNALTACEARVMRALCDLDRADVMIDADAFYVNDSTHEAGAGIRLLARAMGWSEIRGLGSFYEDRPKEMTLIAASRRVGQARTAGQILSEIKSEQHSETAVVLADENALLPVLHAIPESISSLNVSMGYPGRMTSAADLVRLLLETQERSLEVEPRGFYHKDLMRLLHHPFIFWTDPPEVKKLVALLIDWNQVVVSEEEWHRACDAQPCFGRWIKLWKNASEGLTALIELLEDLLNRSPSGLETESLHQILRMVAQVAQRVREHGQPLSFRTLRELLTQLMSELRVPFVGEPLQGMQVLGILETRSLDFKNVILVSANEGILPRSTRRETSIPFELRREWNLPTNELHDGIYAYNVYRLLQRAERIYIIYDSETDELGQGERSRFITQMLHELTAYNPNIQIREELTRQKLTLKGGSRSDVIVKDPAILSLVRAHLERGISGTAIQTYLDCSMQFYYRYVVGLRAHEVIEESIDAMTLGRIVHESLAVLYADFVGHNLTLDGLRAKKDDVGSAVDAAARNAFRGGELRFGKNYLMIQVARQWIERFLSWDMDRIQSTTVRLEGLETETERWMTVSGIRVRFFGRLDRVETVDRETTIIDYKTGKVDKLDSPDVDAAMEQKLMVQLLLYAWLKVQENQSIPQPAIFSFRQFGKALISPHIGNMDLQAAHLMEFEKKLQLWVDEVMNPEVPFIRTNKINRCQNCDFRVICQRQVRESF